jgi:hypothetical protein
MSPSQNDLSDIIVDGLTNYAVALSDNDSGRFGAQMYRYVSREVDALIKPDDVCKLAFPSMMIRPDARSEWLVAIFEDRMIVAWQEGFLRKKSRSVVVPFATIAGMRRHSGSSAATRGAVLITVSGTPEVTFALPVNQAQTAEALIRAALA